jgi:hypothetical protein
MKQLPMATVLIGAALVAGNAVAGKVNMPKEGNYAFELCPIGKAKTFSADDKLFVMHYDGSAVLRTTPAGQPFDRMGARCLGIYSNVNGRQKTSGFCELTDLDGDKWWMEYGGHPDGSGGTYTAAYGTGKYNGMTLQGEYLIDNEWGSISDEVAFQGCNPNKGTYKLM